MSKDYSEALLQAMPFREMCGTKIQCSCGQTHEADIDEVVIGKGTLSFLPELARLHEIHSIFLLADSNTYAAAGEEAQKLLENEGFVVNSLVYTPEKGQWLCADEEAMTRSHAAFDACDPRPELILAVGSGTLNDLGKELAAYTDLPQWVLGTAASMDGLASNNAALVRNHLKVTEYYHCPRVILIDSSILMKAPKAMTVAGICDLAAKYNANLDWQLSALVTGEHYCESIADGMLSAVDQVMDLALSDATWDEGFYDALASGLILSGIYMSYLGNSRPASGLEHHFSHFWEMWLQMNGKPAIYHGTKVGVGLMIADRLYRRFMDVDIEARRVIPRLQKFDEEAYKARLKKVYGPAADSLLKDYRFDAENRIQRLGVILEKRRQINGAIRRMLPFFDKAKAVMEKIGAVMDWTGLPYITGEIAAQALLYCKEVRSRYTLLQALTDVGYHFEKLLPELTESHDLSLSQIQMRDPFVLPVPEEGKYYLFGTTDPSCWVGPFIGFDCFESEDLIHWKGPKAAFRPEDDFWGTKHFWAPEVHRYRGKYYMFATFESETVTKGTAVLRSDTPDGPYKPVSNSHLTPEDWVCLDGTLYTDPQGKPYMVFCHEWSQLIDGTICAMPLNKSLSAAAGKPQVLFAGSEASWAKGEPWTNRHPEADTDALSYVTDGPFLIKVPKENGTEELIMLWSSRGPKGYANGSAYSENGIMGPWHQNDQLVYEEDGGHGMLFTTFDGQLMMALHRPNQTPNERPHFFRARIENHAVVLEADPVIANPVIANPTETVEETAEKSEPVAGGETVKAENIISLTMELPTYLL